MMPPTPTGDTWGISGPAFLIGYLTLAVLAVALAVLARRRLFAGPTGSPPHLDAEQAAHLNGGARLALYTSLGALRAAGTIAVGPDGLLTPTGQLPAGATALDTAVYNAAGQRLRPRSLGAHPWVANALSELRGRLVSAGLAVGPATRRTARLWSLLIMGVAAVGVLRLTAGWAADRPVGYLVPIVAVLALVAVVQFVRVPAATKAGTAALGTLRRQNEYLAPKHSPSYATYGAGGVAMGVALYGTTSLYAADPGFAAQAGVEQNFTGGGSATGGGADSSGSSGSSGSSCSGGGGSCGGGGGCGG